MWYYRILPNRSCWRTRHACSFGFGWSTHDDWVSTGWSDQFLICQFRLCSFMDRSRRSFITWIDPLVGFLSIRQFVLRIQSGWDTFRTSNSGRFFTFALCWHSQWSLGFYYTYFRLRSSSVHPVLVQFWSWIRFFQFFFCFCYCFFHHCHVRQENWSLLLIVRIRNRCLVKIFPPVSSTVLTSSSCFVILDSKSSSHFSQSNKQSFNRLSK